MSASRLLLLSGSAGGLWGRRLEVASDADVTARDLTDRDGGTLSFTATAWQTFTASLR